MTFIISFSFADCMRHLIKPSVNSDSAIPLLWKILSLCDTSVYNGSQNEDEVCILIHLLLDFEMLSLFLHGVTAVGSPLWEVIISLLENKLVELTLPGNKR